MLRLTNRCLSTHRICRSLFQQTTSLQPELMASCAMHEAAAPGHTQAARLWGAAWSNRGLAGQSSGDKDAAAGAESAEQHQQQQGAESEAQPEAEAPEDPVQAAVAEQQQQNAELRERLLRTLADMENLRERTARQAEQTRSFAIQGFLKSLLDVADNLDRAVGTPDAARAAEDPAKALSNLQEGVRLTQRVLEKAFAQNGVEKFSPLGDQFDPNRHEALFQMPDPSKEPGTVGAVNKSGYTLNGRVVRPAEVGVVAKQQ